MFRPDRSRDRPTSYLTWRVRLMGAGAVLALVGMYYDSPWMIWIAIGVLVVGLLMRFLPTGDEDADGGGG